MVALGPVIIGSLMALGVNPLIAILAVAGITNMVVTPITSHARNSLLMGYQYHNEKKWMKIGLKVISIGGAIDFMTSGLVW